MVTVGEIEIMPEQQIKDEGLELAEQVNNAGEIVPIEPTLPKIEELSSSPTPT